MKNNAYDFWDEYAFGEDVKYIIKPIEHTIFPTGYQGRDKETRSACTIIWAVNQLIRLFWLDLDTITTNKLYLEVVHYCEQYGYVIWSGRDIPTATNIVCKWWNAIWYKTFKKEKVFWVRLNWNNERVKEALEKWHFVWFGKNVNFATDQVEWLIWREAKMYPKMVWHRLNYVWVQYIKATWWADISKAERWAVDNYHWAIWEYFAFKELKPYIYNWVYGYGYLIFPESRMLTNIEKEKERINRLKAVNSVIWVLSSTYADLNSSEQLMASALATELRNTEWARKLIEDKNKKVMQWLVDYLSFSWKFWQEEDQKQFSELATFLRKKYNLD